MKRLLCAVWVLAAGGFVAGASAGPLGGVPLSGSSGPQLYFTTENVNREIYARVISQYLGEHFAAEEGSELASLSNWKIYIQPFKEGSQGFEKGLGGKYSSEIPHGVTGDGEVRVYVRDVQDDRNFLNLRMNFKMIAHELAHMVLKIKYPGRKGRLAYDEHSDGTGWGKKGDTRNFFSTEVHNREWETRQGGKNWIRQMQVILPADGGTIKVPVPVVDIMDLKKSHAEPLDAQGGKFSLKSEGMGDIRVEQGSFQCGSRAFKYLKLDPLTGQKSFTCLTQASDDIVVRIDGNWIVYTTCPPGKKPYKTRLPFPNSRGCAAQ